MSFSDFNALNNYRVTTYEINSESVHEICLNFRLRVNTTEHTASKTRRGVTKFLGNLKVCKPHDAIKRCCSLHVIHVRTSVNN